MSAIEERHAAAPPAEGERRAQRGYVRQYQSAAAAIYSGLVRGDLQWIGLADRAAGIADDVVLGFGDRVIGHQFKTSQFPDKFRLETLLIGANGLLRPLAEAWQSLSRAHADQTVVIRLVTNDYPSTSDTLGDGAAGHSAAFLGEFETYPNRTLAEWRASRWRPFIEALCAASGLDELNFEQFLQGFQLLHGSAADFVLTHRLPPESARLVDEIARLLPQLVADPRNKDRWTRAELLTELGWRDSAMIAHHIHRFPIGAHVQRNEETERALLNAIRNTRSGYISLVGPPGAGKSTLLQTALEAAAGLILVRYLAYVPGVGQGIGRGEAEDFLDDIGMQLKRSGLLGVRFRDDTLHERREQFCTLLQQAGERFQRDGVCTLIVVDGLDHVPREEKPQRSFLTELPLPSAIPEGVLFVLGTQRLDLEDLRPAVRDQAGGSGRTVPVSPLRREAVHRMADLMELDASISRDEVFELTHGHPLVTRYLIEALRDADAQYREALLSGAMVFEGDIETVYESAWRTIRDDEEAKEVLDYIARAEGPIPLELLANAVSERAIERALKSTRHLLSDGTQGWSVFHNSFRLFILGKPRMRLGKPDLEFSAKVYRELAKLARIAPHDSHQRWLELRYLARAQEHAAVLELAAPARFREQLAEGRSFTELQADIRLALAAAKQIHDPTTVFRLLLAWDEIGRRWTTLEQSPALVDALLAVGDIDKAQAFAEETGAEGYKVVDALLDAGNFDRARALFDRLEPLQQLLSGTLQGHDLQHDIPELIQWAQRVFHFRDVDQINLAIERLSKAAATPEADENEQIDSQLSERLRYEIALAITASRFDADAEQIGQSFGLHPELLVNLLVYAGLRAAKLGSEAVAMGLLRRAMAHTDFVCVANSWRRRAAIFFVHQGDLNMARAIFDDLQVPSLAELDGQTGDDVSEHMARAVLEHAQLATMLSRPVSEVTASKRGVLRPLQHHANAIGTLLGRAYADAGNITDGEVARSARTALAYLERARPNDSDEFYAMHQIAAATPVLGTALIQAAALCGEREFSAVLAAFDRVFEEPEGSNSRRANLRRAVAVAIYRADGNAEEALRRLEPLVNLLQEETPSMQIQGLADLAISFALTGNYERAQELLARVPAESLGYARPAKKDPQYATWLEFLERANAVDPDHRSERIELLMRQVNGMMQTEGSDAAHRMASSLISEAAMFSAETGLAAARALVQWGTIGWARMVNALMLGMVKRRPEVAHACVVTWCSLALPYYIEPFYRESYQGEFIDAAIEVVPLCEVERLVEIFQAAIETEAQAHERASLLMRLSTAALKREVTLMSLNDAIARWNTESPADRHYSTPTRYDEITSLAELNARFELDNDQNKLSYEASRAFTRLAPGAGFVQAREVFEEWESIRNDSRALYVVINLALDEGLPDDALRLMQDYQHETDDRATWTAWTGGGTLRYFQARVRMEGAAAHKQAYDNFVDALTAGRESIGSVMVEIEDIVSVISQSPNWPEMWDWLAEQLPTTREHSLGHPFDAHNLGPMSDEQMIAALFEWAVSIPLPELHRHVQAGALGLLTAQGGKVVFTQLVRRLLAGEQNEPANALQLLLLDTGDSLSQDLGSTIVALVNHPDYAVAESAAVLARRWGHLAQMTPSELPPFYRFILEEQDEDIERPQLVDPESGAMRIEDPQGWTFMFSTLINSLTRGNVTAEHIRHRCRMFIERWGGLAQFGQPATDRLQSELRRLDMKMTFTRPHVTVAARALRYVAGELRRAGMIGAQEVPFLLHMMGFPAPRLPVILPTPRPRFVHRPSLDDSSWQHTEEKWLQGADSDVRPLLAGGETIIAEFCKFHIRKARCVYTQERIRAPFLEVGDCEGLFEWFALLPQAIWAGRIRALTDRPAPTIVRRFSSSYLPEIPQFQFIICPHLLRRLGWNSHPHNWQIYVSRTGEVVARIVWWRDGSPIDISDDVIWGEGIYVSVTSTGLAQIEATLGSLTVLVNNRRDLTPDSGDGLTQSRCTSARD